MLSHGAGAESRMTIGVVIFSGVLVATLFTLIVVPVFYALLARYTKVPGWVAREIAEFEGRERPAVGQHGHGHGHGGHAPEALSPAE
jgi:multidrug efflux pump